MVVSADSLVVVVVVVRKFVPSWVWYRYDATITSEHRGHIVYQIVYVTISFMPRASGSLKLAMHQPS